jgi:hypothetical protein
MEQPLIEVKVLAQRLRIGPGELIRLAREVSHQGTLVSLSSLRRRDCFELAYRLGEIQAARELHAMVINAEAELCAQ